MGLQQDEPRAEADTSPETAYIKKEARAWVDYVFCVVIGGALAFVKAEANGCLECCSWAAIAIRFPTCELCRLSGSQSLVLI